MDDDELWSAVDDHLTGVLLPADPVLDAALADSAAGGLPEIQVAANQGKLLRCWCASPAPGACSRWAPSAGTAPSGSPVACPATAPLVTLEVELHHAGVARANLERAGFGSRVDVRVGPAADTLAAMVAEGTEPFDFVFLDADKGGYPTYLARALDLSRPGTVIVADNVVRGGAVIDADTTDANTLGVRPSSRQRPPSPASTAPRCRPSAPRATTASPSSSSATADPSLLPVERRRSGGGRG